MFKKYLLRYNSSYTIYGILYSYTVVVYSFAYMFLGQISINYVFKLQLLCFLEFLWWCLVQEDRSKSVSPQILVSIRRGLNLVK